MKNNILRRGILVCVFAAFIITWFYLPLLSYRISLIKLNGSESGQEWEFSKNTFNHRITSDQIRQLYLVGTSRVASIDLDTKSYVYENTSGYMGCITLIQHSGSYEYVGVFGSNDADVLMAGRAMGSFPSERYKILYEVSHDKLPSGIIQPW